MRKVECWFSKHYDGQEKKHIDTFHRWIEEDGETKALLESDEGYMFTVTYRQIRFIEPEKVKANDNHKKNQLEKLWDKNVFDEHVEKGEPYYIGCLLPFESHIPNILNSLRYGKLTPIKYAIPKSHYMIVQVTGKYDGVMGIDTFYDIKNYEESASKLTFIDCD